MADKFGTCAICFNHISSSSAATLHCGHVLDADCLTDSLKLQPECPVCRLPHVGPIIRLYFDHQEVKPTNPNSPTTSQSTGYNSQDAQAAATLVKNLRRELAESNEDLRQAFEALSSEQAMNAELRQSLATQQRGHLQASPLPEHELPLYETYHRDRSRRHRTLADDNGPIAGPRKPAYHPTAFKRKRDASSDEDETVSFVSFSSRPGPSRKRHSSPIAKHRVPHHPRRSLDSGLHSREIAEAKGSGVAPVPTSHLTHGPEFRKAVPYDSQGAYVPRPRSFHPSLPPRPISTLEALAARPFLRPRFEDQEGQEQVPSTRSAPQASSTNAAAGPSRSTKGKEAVRLPSNSSVHFEQLADLLSSTSAAGPSSRHDEASTSTTSNMKNLNKNHRRRSGPVNQPRAGLHVEIPQKASRGDPPAAVEDSAHQEEEQR